MTKLLKLIPLDFLEHKSIPEMPLTTSSALEESLDPDQATQKDAV